MRTGIALRTLPISEKKAKRAAVADDVEEAPEPAADTLDSSKKRRREAEAEVSAPKCKSKWVLFRSLLGCHSTCSLDPAAEKKLKKKREAVEEA